MGARFTDLAVDAVADYLAAHYATYLRAVETELSLGASSLPDPVAYVRADLPQDNRSPRFDIYEESWNLNSDDFDDLLPIVDVSVVWSYLGDAAVENGELITRRCLTALLKCIYADRSLGGAVVECLFGTGSAGAIRVDNKTRHGFRQVLKVQTQEVL
jgi:hypothetical protein